MISNHAKMTNYNFNSSTMKIEPTTLGTDPVRLNVFSPTPEDTTKKTIGQHRFINFNQISNDLKNFSDTFNSYATKKTFVTGFFNIALIGKYS